MRGSLSPLSCGLTTHLRVAGNFGSRERVYRADFPLASLLPVPSFRFVAFASDRVSLKGAVEDGSEGRKKEDP